MSKLRLVKDRSESNDFEQDLRGMGEELSVKEASPIAILSIKSAASDNALKTILDMADFANFQITKTFGYVHIELQNKMENVKEQSVYLYVLALMASESIPGELNMSLWVADRFKFHYTNSIKGNSNEEFSIEKVFQKNSLENKNSLNVLGAVGMYLNQAGFNGFKNELGNQLVSKEQLKQNLKAESQKQLSTDNTQQVKSKRVG